MDKDISLPEIDFVPIENAGGVYYQPEEKEVLLFDRYYPLEHGLILVDPIWPEDIAETVAHEWRHHWQFMRGYDDDGIYWPDCPEKTYEQKIIHYFTHSRTEMDALLFSHRMAPTDTTGEWIEWLIRRKK